MANKNWDDNDIEDNDTISTTEWMDMTLNNIVPNTSARHNAVTVTDSSEIDFTLSGQNITASLIAGSIDVLKLDSGVQSSLGLADSALQNGDNISELTNNENYTKETFITEYITLTSTDITNKYKDLSNIPVDNTSVNISIVGGCMQFYTDDFTVITDGTDVKRLNWNGLDMESILAENDEIVVNYTYNA